MKLNLICLALFPFALFHAVGCSSTYYAVWQKLGYEKRDILVSRVQDARDDQNAAKDQFKTTLDSFKDVTSFNGGDLEAKYKKLSSEYDTCESRAQAVSKKVASVDKVATDMFNEWQAELDQYSDQNLRKQSEEKLSESKAKYAVLLSAMAKSEASMVPVLKAFHDQVLFLKHNLNASAISSLQDTAKGIDVDVQGLIKDMNASIDEANSFIDNLKKS